MKNIKGFRLWQILYPVLIYYVVESVAFLFLGIILGTANETYMMRQMFCALFTIPFLYGMFYKKDCTMEKIVMKEENIRTVSKERRGSYLAECVRNFMFAVFGTATLGIALNNILAQTPLMTLSEGYQETNIAFFAGTILFELLGSGFVIPIVEELLFRGIVYKRLRIWMGWQKALVFSALLFGLIHMNLVQFIYAGVLGAFLAFLLEKTGKLWVAVVGHMAANIVAILRAETGWLAFSYEMTFLGIGFTCLMVLAAGAIILFLYRENT
ncbi:MAG: lysostaphin resistance A-like protein [Roseburia sp.]